MLFIANFVLIIMFECMVHNKRQMFELCSQHAAELHGPSPVLTSHCLAHSRHTLLIMSCALSPPHPLPHSPPPTLTPSHPQPLPLSPPPTLTPSHTHPLPHSPVLLRAAAELQECFRLPASAASSEGGWGGRRRGAGGREAEREPLGPATSQSIEEGSTR